MNLSESMSVVAITGASIIAVSGFDANDRTVIIGDGTANGCNNFDTSNTGVYLNGQQNVQIDINNFGLNKAYQCIAVFRRK